MQRPAAPVILETAAVPGTAPSGTLTVSLEPLPDLASLGALWTDLEERADGSFFLSWPWVRCWLGCLPEEAARPALLVVRDGDTVSGLALLGRRRARRHGVLSSRQWLLHETGDPDCDALFVEYNGILADRRQAAAVTAAGLDWLVRQAAACDELVLGGVPAELAERATAAARQAGRLARVTNEMPTYQVDLHAVRRSGGDYLAGLSRNTRGALRRALRLYEAAGGLEFRSAATLAEALDDFADLKRLHQAAWTARGRPGAFAAPFFERFHTTLIRDAFPAGHIQLCRIGAGGRPIGYLYNFLWRGRTHSYQSGFDYTADAADNRLKPGLVSHYLAVIDGLRRGASLYDFMAGEAQYKQSLATPGTRLVWLTLATDRLPFRVESWLRGVKHRLAG